MYTLDGIETQFTSEWNGDTRIEQVQTRGKGNSFKLWSFFDKIITEYRHYTNHNQVVAFFIKTVLKIVFRCFHYTENNKQN